MTLRGRGGQLAVRVPLAALYRSVRFGGDPSEALLSAYGDFFFADPNELRGLIDLDLALEASVLVDANQINGFMQVDVTLEIDVLSITRDMDLTGSLALDVSLGRGTTDEVPLDNAALTVGLPQLAPDALRWRLFDGVDTYAFTINPASLVIPYQLNVATQATTGGGVVLVQGAPTPGFMRFSGSLVDQDQYDALVVWLRKRRRVHLYDHLGRRTEVIVRSFAPTPRRAYAYPWLHEYTMTMVVLSDPVTVA